MKLLWSPNSPFARKVRVVAREHGLARWIEEVSVDAFSDPEALTTANPLGKVPTLIYDANLALFDSSVICAYLDGHVEATGERLIPASGTARWQILRLEALADGIMDLALGLVLERRKPEAEKSPTTARRWHAQLTRSIDAIALEADMLRSRGLTLAHIAIGCALSYLDFRHPDIGWRNGRDHLAKWFLEFEQRPSFIETAPPKQPA